MGAIMMNDAPRAWEEVVLYDKMEKTEGNGIVWDHLEKNELSS